MALPGTQDADDGAAMSPRRRTTLISYLLVLGLTLVYVLVKLLLLDFADPATIIEAPRARIEAPANTTPAQPPPPAQPPGENATPRRPVLLDVFPHVRSDPAPSYELALYGRDFDPASRVRLNGRDRPPKATPEESLIIVVPTEGDLIGPATLIVEVMNPRAMVSNALAVKIDRPRQPLEVFAMRFPITREVQLILLVLVAGTLGSLLHAVKSIADYIGNRNAMTSWFWFYITRPYVGATMALIFYAVLRGGFLTGTPADVRVVNPFGAVAVAALVGMFSDKAARKLAEIFEILFRSEDRRGGTLGAPVIDKLVPPTAPISDKPIELRIVGERLGGVRTVKVDDRDRNPEKVAEKEVIVKLLPEDLQKPGKLRISVVTNDATSTSVTLHVSDLAITTKSPLPTGKVGTPYTAKLDADGGSRKYSWSMDPLPAGLKLDSKTGSLSGQPTKDGKVDTAVTVADSAGASATGKFEISIDPVS